MTPFATFVCFAGAAALAELFFRLIDWIER